MTPTDEPVVSAYDQLDAVQRGIVANIDAAAQAADGTSALDDQVRLDLEFGGTANVRHLLVRDAAEYVVGYAHLYRIPSQGFATAHVVVNPTDRKHGAGTALINRLRAEAGDLTLRVWSHGDEHTARALSTKLGFRRVRELRQLHADLAKIAAVAGPDEPAYPAEVTVRTFVVGQDEQAWLEVNAAAFAHHPEQGRLTLMDLQRRMSQDWFDPAGFFLAEDNGTLLGFHWTKVHADGASDGGPIGEVYVVGVSPDAQGLGLGRSLTTTGLRYLHHDRGLAEALLYVDSDNVAALRVYEGLGFSTAKVDVMYEHEG